MLTFDRCKYNAVYLYTQSICELQNVSVAQGTIDKRIYKHFDFMKLLITQKPCKTALQ